MRSANTINLVSIYTSRQNARGPGKVFHNLVKGLDKIEQPYRINHSLNSTRRLWIHSDMRALLELPRSGTVNVLGPSLCILPMNLATRRPFPRSVYLMHCEWAAKLWAEEGFNQCPIRIWPTGVDTDEFSERPPPGGDAPVLVYYKMRFPHELNYVERLLKRLHLNYQVLVYNNYGNLDYGELLRRCSFIIWLGHQETNAIALLEALAAGVPVLVLDALTLYHDYPVPRDTFPESLQVFPTTSAPYFDPRCGIILDSLDSAEEGIELMRERLTMFHPREFILDTLSLEKQAREFVEIFEELEQVHSREETIEFRFTDRSYTPKPRTVLRWKMFNQKAKIRRAVWLLIRCLRSRL